MNIPINSHDIRSVYIMDRSGVNSRRFKKDRNPRMERIKRKALEFIRRKEAEKNAA